MSDKKYNKETPEQKPRPERKRKGGPALGIHHSKMSVPDGVISRGKVGRWINDTKNRIDIALGDDWDFVLKQSGLDSTIGNGFGDKNTDIGDKISQVVGTDGKSNEPMRAYLMEKWQDWYEEDQAVKDEKILALDKSIGRGGLGLDIKAHVDKSQFYGKIDYKA